MKTTEQDLMCFTSTIDYDHVINLLPKNVEVYCEPFGQCASVLLNKPTHPREVLNELNLENFWVLYYLKNHYDQFYQAISSFDCCEATYIVSKQRAKRKNINDPLELAIHKFIIENMGQIYEQQRPRKTENYWYNIVNNLYYIHQRLQDVLLTNDIYDSVLQLGYHYNNSAVFVCNVPSNDNKTQNNQWHINLANKLQKLPSKVLVYYKDTMLYNSLYKEWYKVTGRYNGLKYAIWTNYKD